jgi:hypothetical protein
MAATADERQQPEHCTVPAPASHSHTNSQLHNEHQSKAERSLSGLKHCSGDVNLLWLTQTEAMRGPPLATMCWRARAGAQQRRAGWARADKACAVARAGKQQDVFLVP